MSERSSARPTPSARISAAEEEEDEALLSSSRQSDGHVLVWNKISATVPMQGAADNKEGKRTVLREVSGVAYPNEVLAIMGGSGAGKTTLMNILAFLETKGVERQGTVLVNGKEMDKQEVRAMSAYVQQIDLFVGTLTVREQLTYSALLRMGRNYSKREKMDKVEEVIRQFNLLDCQKTIIGVPNKVKGISVGEKKRLAFACEVLTNPSILFCDEPTSGLDAFMASQVVSTMRLLADQGKTVISVIHQPSSSTFKMFHKVLLMANGRPAYHGPVSEICAFFAGIQLPVPESYNPADHAISQLAISPESKERDVKRIGYITQQFEQSQAGSELVQVVEMVFAKRGENFQQDPAPNPAKQKKRRPRGYAAGFLTQMSVLLRRAFLTTLRDPVLLKVRAIQVIATAIIVGIVNWQLEVKAETVQNIEGMLYNTCRDMNFLFLFPSINVVTSELPVLMREHKAHIYSTAAYFLSKSLAELPQYIIMPLVYSLIAYWMTGLVADAGTFLMYLLLCTLMVWNAISVAYASACAFGDEGTAVTYTPLFVLPMLVLGGFYISFSAIPVYLQWLSRLSWFRYSFEGLQINQWRGIDSIGGCEPSNGTLAGNLTTAMNPHCPGTAGGSSVLMRRGMDGSLPMNIGLMVTFTLGYRLLAFVALVLRTRFAK